MLVVLVKQKARNFIFGGESDGRHRIKEKDLKRSDVLCGSSSIGIKLRNSHSLDDLYDMTVV